MDTATEKVTGGVLFFYGTAPRGLTIISRKFTAAFLLGDTGSFSIPDGPHAPGAVIDISGNLAGGQTLRKGPGYFGGTVYTSLWYEGSLQFRASPITVPPNSALPASVSATFTLSGTLKAFKANNINGTGGPPVFDVGVTGSGISTATFEASFPGTGGTVRSVKEQCYVFTSR